MNCPKKVMMSSIAILVFSIVSHATYAITEAKEKDILTLLNLMGNMSIAEEMANSMVTISITQEKQRYPSLPKEVEYALSNALYDVVISHSPELDQLIVPLYDKYYTHKEIRDLIVFFQTQTGRKYSAVLMPMMQEIIPIAQDWAKKVAPIAAAKAKEELEKNGYN